MAQLHASTTKMSYPYPHGPCIFPGIPTQSCRLPPHTPSRHKTHTPADHLPPAVAEAVLAGASAAALVETHLVVGFPVVLSGSVAAEEGSEEAHICISQGTLKKAGTLAHLDMARYYNRTTAHGSAFAQHYIGSKANR